MKCSFNSCPLLDIISSIFTVIALVLFFAFVFEDSGKLIPVGILGGVVFFVASITLYSTDYNGEISADDTAVSITYRIFSVITFTRKYEYSLIEYTSTDVEVVGGQGIVIYWLTLSVNTKNGKKIKLQKKLDIPRDMPANEPDKYKEHLNNQPLSQISDFINEKLEGVCTHKIDKCY